MKREKKIYHNAGTVPKSNRKIVERREIDTTNMLTFLDWYRHFIKKKWRGLTSLWAHNMIRSCKDIVTSLYFIFPIICGWTTYYLYIDIITTIVYVFINTDYYYLHKLLFIYISLKLIAPFVYMDVGMSLWK